jgi:hypothetical protein
MMARLASLFLFTILGGCGDIASQLPPPNENPPEYKKIIQAALQPDAKAAVSTGIADRITKLPNKYAPFEISRPRQVNVLAGWTWRVCLKGNNKGSVVYLAVFIKGNNIVDVRTSVGTDRCEGEFYEPFS